LLNITWLMACVHVCMSAADDFFCDKTRVFIASTVVLWMMYSMNHVLTYRTYFREKCICHCYAVFSICTIFVIRFCILICTLHTMLCQECILHWMKEMFVSLVSIWCDHYTVSIIKRNVHRVSKNVPPLACYNFDTCERILIFFGRNVTNKGSSQKTLYYSTSNNLWFCTTW